MKRIILAGLMATSLSFAPCFAAAKNESLEKKTFKFTNGDCTFTIGGKTKIEHYFQRNMALLNKELPDEFNYFKNTFDLIFDFAYGAKSFGHEAVKAYTKLRHKGVWGRGAVYADSDNTSASPVKISDSFLKPHSHTSGKPLMWINEAWLQFSLNAIAGSSSERLHTIKLGWFPFELGRGIALGAAYGINREGFGLNTYVEDKGAPGILLHGVLKQDVLSYDVYYAKFESRSKSLGDTLNSVKEQLVGRKTSPWRGSGKDNDLFAGRLKWKPVNNDSFGSLEFEPYALYQNASDQKIKILADSRVELGTFGLAIEHKGTRGFECGIEGAFNLGTQRVYGIDQNRIEVARVNELSDSITTGNTTDGTAIIAPGYLVERFTHIQKNVTDENRLAAVNKDSKEAAQVIATNDSQTLKNNYISKTGRFLAPYTNNLRGYMITFDLAQKIEDYDLTLAAAYGFASGDENPHKDRKDKTHMGFIGVHEAYTGKRVTSVMFLDEMRGVLSIPGAIGADETSVDNNELSFTNLHHLGFGSTWNPLVADKKFVLNPNMLFYWKALAPHKFDTASEATTSDFASRFMGTELNVKIKMELLKDLEVFGNFGVFIPGRMFTDVQGMKFENSYGNDAFFDMLSTEEGAETDGLKQSFRLGTNVAYHANIGLNYSF